MSDIHSASIGFIAPIGDFGRHNSQVTGSVNHLWKDFYAQAMAEQSATDEFPAIELPLAAADENAEPSGGNDVLSAIVTQRHCNVQDTEIKPPEALFLPIAEFELDLLPPTALPFPPDVIAEQQHQQAFNEAWVRPLVMAQGQPLPEPGPAPEPRPLHLPIAEFEMDLLDKPAEPFDAATLSEQQHAMDFDLAWTRPLIVNNLRLAA
ncbi:energy transducer TonB [Pseudomonas sp. FSL R10-1350]|uniref:Energy transducer TonB n=1 Tax=Pseudomonas helleri TaxID=1608996 RepID=A0A6A7YFD9_9PSED|nr:MULTISPECIES: energy transducer TonB [Pseudomonas]MQT29464.1 energy transducer TonB [Pseudomonas helleri]MQT47175.1 energy transducer TonB [Pseudomonas helleri]MQT87727.1 energy transducer TonB [Pseudomonas helleri]MQU65036.1 energy transducer TonB [Pseudomonas sp. FSL R10-1350]